MKYTVSRPLEAATKDVEWPGPDNRRWRQTTLCNRQPPASSPPPPPSCQDGSRSVSPSLRGPAAQPLSPSPPLSPSLRASADLSRPLQAAAKDAIELPAVDRGQTRITGLVRVSTR